MPLTASPACNFDWVYSFIGKPWINGVQDCWWLVRAVYREQLAVDLPVITVDSHNIREVLSTLEEHPHLSEWEEIAGPEDYCMVFFNSARNRPTHVALYLAVDGGRYLHTYQRAGCVCESLPSAERNGWTRPRFYRYNGGRKALNP